MIEKKIIFNIGSVSNILDICNGLFFFETCSPISATVCAN